MLERLGLGAAGRENPRDLSGGEQQRVALASILAANPQIILLDEPTRGLDYAQKRSLADLLLGMKREGRTIIMATHDVELAAACADRAVLMAEGQIIVDGPAREVMSDSQVFASQINKLFRDRALSWWWRMCCGRWANDERRMTNDEWQNLTRPGRCGVTN